MRAAFAAIGALPLVCTLYASLGSAQVWQAEEGALKAAFIFNFLTFTEWPASAFATPTAPFQICVFGPTPVEPAIHALEGRSVAGRSLVVRDVASEEEARSCHLLYFGALSKDALSRALRAARATTALTVGDETEFARDGGMIALVRANNRIALAINVDVTVQAGLKLSSKLLSLAVLVSK